MGQYAWAEDSTLTLRSHVGILSFLPCFLSSQLVISSSEHVCYLYLKGSGGQWRTPVDLGEREFQPASARGLLISKPVFQENI